MNGGTASVTIVLIFVGAFAVLGFLASQHAECQVDLRERDDQLAAAADAGLRCEARVADRDATIEACQLAVGRCQQAVAEAALRLRAAEATAKAVGGRNETLQADLKACRESSDVTRLASGDTSWGVDWPMLAPIVVACAASLALGSLATAMMRGVRS